jgi:transcriptional regulator with XRE-family HTH domain
MDFGVHLREFRTPKLSQQKLGELLGKELGMSGYSGAAISDWERGKSKIHADDRRVLIALIKVLHENGGIHTIEDANQFLEAGDYRVLNRDEIRKIFQEVPNGIQSEQLEGKEKNPDSRILFWFADMFSISREELNEIQTKTGDARDLSWAQILAAFMRKVSERITVSVSTILWFGVWLLTIGLISPSLRFPFADYESAFVALVLYAGASLVIPLLIGSLVNTNTSDYWKGQSGVNPFLLRLYTYQGAGLGFNVGYFLVFPLSLFRYYLGLAPSVWIEIVAATTSLILGHIGARVVPHNLWLAYKQLRLRDGWIFFIVVLMGPLWSFFFLEYYSTLLQPVLGIVVILLALLGVVLIAKRSSKK